MTQLIWSDGELLIRRPPAWLKNRLYYYHKSLEETEGKDYKSVTEKVYLYWSVPHEPEAIVTYQGFVDWVIARLKEHNSPYQFFDNRQPFPRPDYNRMHGLRWTQLGMIAPFLAFNRSGLFQAPTRFGKTLILINVIRAFPNVKTVLAAPGVNLLGQLEEELRHYLPGREIRGIYSGSRHRAPSEDITVCSLDSLHKVDVDSTRLLLIDEPHKIAAPKKINLIAAFRNARMYGFGATLEGRFDGADCMIRGLVGPVLVRKNFQAAVKEGSICPIRVYMMRLHFDPWKCDNRREAYNRLVYTNYSFNRVVRAVCQKIPQDWQTLIFIDQIHQADMMSRLVEDGVRAIAKRMKAAERRAIYNKMASGEIKRCLATDIYAQGVTFPDLRCIVNAAGGGGSISSIQRPGRLAERRPYKEAGYVIDFLFTPADDLELPKGLDKWRMVQRDSYNRLDTYRKLGYEVQLVDELDQINLR